MAALAAPLGGGGVAFAQPFAYVLGDRAGTDLVTVIDTATGTKVTSIPVGSGGPALFGGGIAAAPDGARVYVVNITDQTVSVIDTMTNTPIATFSSGPEPTTLAVSPDGSRLYVGNRASGSSQAAIRVIGTATGAVVGVIPLGPPPTFTTLGMAISPDGRRLYATGWTGTSTGNTVKVIDVIAGAVVATIPVLTFPTAVAMTPDGAHVYVGHLTSGTGTVSVISTASNTVIGTVPVGVNPQSLAVTPDGTRVFVPNNGVPFSVSIIGRHTNSVIGSIPGQLHMRAIAFTPDGSRALAPWDDGVAVFDAVANVPAGSIPFNVVTEGMPRAVVVLPMPPDPPTDLFASSIVGNQVTLQWRTPPTGPPPTSFVVQGGVLPGETLATLATGSALPSFTFEAPTGVFFVRVRGRVGGVAGAPSNEIRIFVSPPMPPSAPEGLLGLVDGSSLSLAWRNTFTGGAASGIILEVAGKIATTLTLPPSETFTYAGVPPGTNTL
jgi:YVTN family beta-propeller protein